MPSMPRDWDRDVVTQYLSMSPSDRSDEVFQQLHLPLTKIYTEWAQAVYSEDFITQSEFHDIITGSELRDFNRLFLLEGSSGSGKTHLCTWLARQIGTNLQQSGTESHIAIPITRSEQSLNSIFEALTKHVSIEPKTRSIDDVDPDRLANALVEAIRVFNLNLEDVLSNMDRDKLTDSYPDERGLRELLRDNIRTYQRAWATGSNPVLELISRTEYQQLTEIALGREPTSDEFMSFRWALQDCFIHFLGVQNIDASLTDIANAYVELGIRPVLLFDDFLSLGPLWRILLDYFVKLSSGHFDIIIGVPDRQTDTERRNEFTEYLHRFTGNMRRFAGHLRLSDSDGHSYFLTDDAAVDLVRKYVHAIRTASSAEFDTEVVPTDFDGLYPFNEPFVHNLYRNLQIDGKPTRTPQLLLRVIQNCLLDSEPPFESVEKSDYVSSRSVSRTSKYPTDVRKLLKWYGRFERNTMQISSDHFETFDVDIPNKMARDRSIELTDQ